MNQHLDNALQDSPLASVLGMPQVNPNKKAQGVMVFVSLSMPDTALKQLLKQSQQYQVPLVIRGVLPEGMVPTASRIMDLLKASDEGDAIEGGFAISPQWFRQFNITHVPVFVAIGEACNEAYCPQSDYDMVHGNLSLPNALTILSQGDVGHIAKQVINRSSP
ncbi:type-F conjugative transfer system pilin assembly protein TrbC [Vibrio atlanticus]|uniref:type-F conjugative transfer system pilin assembly protein TrbC n=1 Tax=Vibrio atlanticus TaxID=693153 RepID=UPI003D0E719C